MKRSKGKGKSIRNFSQRLHRNLSRRAIVESQKEHLVKLAKRQELVNKSRKMRPL